MTFARCYVINLRRRPDRLYRFFRRLGECDWPFVPPVVFDAIDGDKVGVPEEFSEGGGAYGCRMSHLWILQRCLMDDIPSVLVLEDDADLRPGFGPAARAFLENVPPDWTGILFGGQHHAPPWEVRPGVVRVQYAQRTHAYGCRGVYMRDLQRRWGNATVHIDWRMENWQHRYAVYAPRPWLIGQFGGRSDIRGAEKAAEWWQERQTEAVPVVVLQAPRRLVDELHDFGWHSGFYRDPETGVDNGLNECFHEASTPEDFAQRLRKWHATIREECRDSGAISVIWHPKANAETIRAALDAPVVGVRADDVDEAVQQLPEAWRRRLAQFAARNLLPVVVLRCNRLVMEQLRTQGGWHFGDDLDLRNGYDKVLNDISRQTGADFRRNLRRWIAEARRTARHEGRLVAVWHPSVSSDALMEATPYPVLEINAPTAEECRERLREAALHGRNLRG